MEPRWIWPFELLEKIGEGGMGTVYRARYAGNDRQVAVKLLPSEVAADSVLLARFERELAVLKQLRHPNIVRCFGGTCETEQRFYAMELVDGGTLADLLQRKGHLSWEAAVDYALQMCEALQYAHEHGVIHRDIKPGNFLLTKSGQIKLSDFGLVSVVSANRLTAAGRTVGTIQYMSPEQIRGKPALTGRADLYALGCVLFEMLTGHPPYSGDNAAEVLHQHLKGPIPHVMEAVLDCPLKLDQLIFELMRKDPEHRPATAAEVGFRLEEILQPGRRATAVEPQLFGRSMAKSKIVSPLPGIPRTPSDAAVQIPTRSLIARSVPWIVTAVLVAVSIGIGIGWSHTTARLRHAEQMWVELLEQPDHATRRLAARSLSQFGPLQASTIVLLHSAIHDADPEMQVAALTILAHHPAECHSLQSELLHLEKVEENAAVRHQAGLTIEALKHAPAAPATSLVIFWTALVTIVAGLVVLGWRLWQQAKSVA